MSFNNKRAFLLRKVCSLPVQTRQKVLPVQSLARNRHYSGPASGRQLQPQTDKIRSRGHREHGAPLKGTRLTIQRCTRLMQSDAELPYCMIMCAGTCTWVNYTQREAWVTAYFINRAAHTGRQLNEQWVFYNPVHLCASYNTCGYTHKINVFFLAAVSSWVWLSPRGLLRVMLKVPRSRVSLWHLLMQKKTWASLLQNMSVCTIQWQQSFFLWTEIVTKCMSTSILY